MASEASAETENVVQHIPALRRFAFRFSKTHDEADDLVQETLLRALSHIGSFVPGTNIKSWLFTIMRNAHNTRYHRNKRIVSGIEDFDTYMPAVGPSQEWIIRAKEVDVAFRSMPRHHQEAANLVLLGGVSYEDAAAASGCALGTVKSRVNRARKFLANALGDTLETAAHL
jgi:RNA polymerase sigma-70 factor (ECF subfamily)